MRRCRRRILLLACAACAVAVCCGTIPIKQYYVLNYVPMRSTGRLLATPYPFTIRLKELDIEDAYNRSQIVYRQSPYELRYYFYKLWAVGPKKMITDLIQKHLESHQFREPHHHGVMTKGSSRITSCRASSRRSKNTTATSCGTRTLRYGLRLPGCRTAASCIPVNSTTANACFNIRRTTWCGKCRKSSNSSWTRRFTTWTRFFSREYGAAGRQLTAGADSSRQKEIEKFRGEGGE